jgi:sodium/potassium-transporting ATPase subunit alpha
MDQEEEKVAPRVRFGELRLPDEEDGYATHERRHERNLSRRSSVGSLSIRSAGGARTVQPETALPITCEQCFYVDRVWNMC